MSADSKRKAAAALEGAVASARWEGLTAEEIKAVVTAALLKGNSG